MARKNSTTEMVMKTKEEMHQEYLNRMTYVRQGQSALTRKDYAEAIKNYNRYLAVVGRDKGSKPFELTPVMFANDDSAELMLISHIYWDLAKIYDLAPTFGENFQKSIDQFVKFSVKQPYHVVNTGLVRKYIKKGVMKNKSAFERAHSQIYASSKKCFVATYCYGEDHPITEDLRIFRDQLIHFKIGESLVNNYYKYSPGVVDFCQNSGVVGIVLKTLVFKPTIFIVTKIIRPLIS